jgi:copper homeostasis protein
MSHLLEIIAYCIEACTIAENAGADRIELCDNPGDGGTTPSLGMIRMARKNTGIPLFPIIRPRGGDFLYSDDEYCIMQADVRFCRDAGCDGVVIGLLRPDGTIDRDRTARLVELAYPMEVTFHRAFDWVKDPIGALEIVVDCGCSRILTSGLRPTAVEGAALIRELHELAAGRIIIMPGSGVRSPNILDLAMRTGVTELHSSASSSSISSMTYMNQLMITRPSHILPDPDEIRKMKAILAAR